MALISGGEYSLLPIVTRTSPLGAALTLYGTNLSAFCTSASLYLRPIKRLMEKTVFSELSTAWRRATWPTVRSPVLGLTATTEGMSREPSDDGMTTGSPPSMTATTELVVPRSMPIIFDMSASLQLHSQSVIELNDRLLFGHPHQRGPDNSVTDTIALAHHADHLAGRVLIAVLVRHGFVQRGVESLALRLDALDALGVQDILQLALDEADAGGPFGQRGHVVIGRAVLHGAVEVVQHIDKAAKDAGGGILKRLALLFFHAALVVGELSPRALPAIQVFG